MTDPEYYRVNVSTATSPPRYNEFGDKYAEVDMLLPSNLLPTFNVRSARMALMKMEVSVAKVPFVVVDTPSNTGSTFLTNCYIGFLPAHFFNGRFVRNTTGFSTVQNWRRMNVSCSNLNQGNDELAIRIARENGTCEFQSIPDLCNWMSTYLTNVIPNDPKDRVLLTVNEDNTFSLKCEFCNTHSLLYTPEYRCPNDVIKNGASYVVENTSLDEKYRAVDINFGYFVGNAALAHEFPSLPWVKILPYWSDGISMFDGEPPVDYLYVLDTKQSNYSFTLSENICRYDSGGETFWYRYPVYNYKFSTSDVVACSDISSVVLTMSGASFNQMVYPVNMSRTTLSAAQTTTVPILDVFYPFWEKPGDTKTDLIIVKENFSSAAPCNINPSLLRERSIKFKMYYITNSGEMREMFIPKDSNFSFQICFELNSI